MKNALAVLPAFLAHRMGEPEVLELTAWAVVALSLCASGTYVVNDLLDREHDRAHPTKRHRPFASGALSVQTGIVLAIGLVGGAFGLAALTLPPAFLIALSAYTVTTLAYSLRLKSVPLLDVLVLGGLYALRIMAGGAATGIPLSEWLLAFSMFFFLGLALLKRYTELRRIETGEASTENGRGYVAEDAALVRVLGPVCGLLSILVLALYMSSPEIQTLYAHPSWIGLALPAVLYWTMRMWLLAHRGQMLDDPVLFAVKDGISYGVIATVALVLTFAAR
ncbi:MAG: hypothetical protein Rubg2KO_24100 [Rubricoccaceae bacterium]